MAAMTGISFLMSRSCLVPINLATTRSSICAASMDDFAVSRRFFGCSFALRSAMPPVQTSYSNWLGAPAPRNANNGLELGGPWTEFGYKFGDSHGGPQNRRNQKRNEPNSSKGPP